MIDNKGLSKINIGILQDIPGHRHGSRCSRWRRLRRRRGGSKDTWNISIAIVIFITKHIILLPHVLIKTKGLRKMQATLRWLLIDSPQRISRTKVCIIGARIGVSTSLRTLLLLDDACQNLKQYFRLHKQMSYFFWSSFFGLWSTP